MTMFTLAQLNPATRSLGQAVQMVVDYFSGISPVCANAQ
jgi:hypothetical protein